MVIEDDIVLNRMFCKYLTSQGYQVEGVYSRAAAIDFISYGTLPDLCVVDLELHDGSSQPILSLLEEPRYRHIHIIIASGNAFNKGYEVNEERMAHILRKPVSPRYLAQLVVALVPSNPLESDPPTLPEHPAASA